MSDPIGPIFFAMQVEDDECLRCGANYVAHGPRLECPAWAIDKKLRKKEEDSNVKT